MDITTLASDSGLLVGDFRHLQDLSGPLSKVPTDHEIALSNDGRFIPRTRQSGFVARAPAFAVTSAAGPDDGIATLAVINIQRLPRSNGTSKVPARSLPATNNHKKRGCWVDDRWPYPTSQLMQRQTGSRARPARVPDTPPTVPDATRDKTFKDKSAEPASAGEVDQRSRD